MALNSDALTTLANLKEEVGIATADTSKDSRLERVINRATRWIEKETGRKLKARNYNGFNATGEGSDFDHRTGSSGHTVPSEDFLYFSGNDAITDDQGRGVLHLPVFPVLKVNSSARSVIHHPNAITFRLDTIDDRGSTVSGYQTWTNLTEWDDYVVEQEAGIVKLLGSVFTPGIRNYRVKCTAGYSVGAADTQPYTPDDLEELCILVAKHRFLDKDTVRSESLGTWSRSYDTEKINDVIEEKLSHFRRYSL